MTNTQRRTKTSNLSPLTVALAENVRALAGRKMLGQMDLVRATGINKKQMSLIWRGMQEMTIDEMSAIFRALGEDPATWYARSLRQADDAPHIDADQGTSHEDSVARGA